MEANTVQGLQGDLLIFVVITSAARLALLFVPCKNLWVKRARQAWQKRPLDERGSGFLFKTEQLLSPTQQSSFA